MDLPNDILNEDTITKTEDSIDYKDERGDTPLLRLFDDCLFMDFFFDITQAKQILVVLKRNAANILAKNKNGDTVLHLIIKTLKIFHSESSSFYNYFDDTGHAKLVDQVLRINNGLLEIKNNEDETPLQLAILMTSTDIVKILLIHKANVNSLKLACGTGNIFCYPQIVPTFEIVQNIMNIIDLLTNEKFEFSLEDHLMIIKFLVHEADFGHCSCTDDDDINLYKVIQFGTGIHAKQVLSEMNLQIDSGDYLPCDLYIMKEANFYMDKELEEIMISFPRSNSFVLDEKARKELAILKSDIKLKSGVMLYDLMLQHPFKASRFLKDDNFDLKLIDGFIQFKDIILGFVTKAIVRNYIVKRAYEFVALTPLALLPALCFEVVLSYLSNLDIFYLCASALLPESNNV